MADTHELTPSSNCPDCHVPLKKGKDKWFCPECGYSVSFSCASQMPDEAIVAEDARLSFPARFNNLPSIIAIPLKEYYCDEDPVLKLWHACDVVELTLRMIVAVGFSDINGAGGAPEKLLNELRGRILEPTLGKWKGMAQAVVESLPAQSFIPEAPEFINETLLPFIDGTAAKKTVETSFSALRNHLAHGGGITKKRAQDLLKIWSPKFEKIYFGAAWLSDLIFLVKSTSGTFGIIRGPENHFKQIKVDSDNHKKTLEAVFARGDEVALLRSGKILKLWPLALYGLPVNPDPDAASALAAAPQMYVRRGEIHLEFTPIGSDEVCQSISDKSALDVFMNIFRFDSPQAAKGEKFEIAGFEGDINKDAARLVGRVEEIAAIKNALSEIQSGVLWLSGNAGIGKSYLMAAVASDVLDNRPDNTIVLPYRFKAGDHRCTRHSFLKYSIERLKVFLPEPDKPAPEKELTEEGKRAPKEEKPKDPEEELFELLKRPEGGRVIFILDGLDEISQKDPSFARDIPLKEDISGVAWLCAGRPERSLIELFTAEKCKILFPDGVPEMKKSDIRAMVLEKIGPLRKKLLLNDKEKGEDVVNPFIEKVAECAKGLPLYVTYVIGDILSGRMRALDAGERMPKSLEAYHEELLKRFSLGTFHQILTPIVCHLAISYEPLSIEMLAELLVSRTILSSPEKAQNLIRQALTSVQSIIRGAQAADGSEGFTLFHASLREHMEKSATTEDAVLSARAALCKFVMDPEMWKSNKIGKYFLRWGVRHLIEAEKWDEVEKILTDLNFIDAKCVAGMTYELVEDYHKALESLPEAKERVGEEKRHQAKIKKYVDDLIKYSSDPDNNPLPHIDSVKIMTDEEIDAKIDRLKNSKNLLRLEKIEEFARFVNGSAHELVKYAVNNPKFCIQQAYNSAEGGIVADQAEELIDKIKDVPLLLYKKGARNPYNPCPALLKIFDWHTDCVFDVAITLDGKIAVSGSDDKSLRVWDIASGKCLNTLEGHTEAVRAVAITPDGKTVISGSDDKSLRVWDVATGKCLRILDGHTDDINSVAITPDGKIAVSGSGKFEGFDSSLRVWDVATGKCLRILEGHIKYVKSVAITPDGKMAVSGSNDNTLRVWDIATGKCLYTLAERHTYFINSVAITPDGKTAVSGSGDKSLRVWDVGTGKCLCTLEGHTGSVLSVAITPDGKTAVSGSDDITLRVWDVGTGKCLCTLEGHIDYVRSVAVTPDGKIAVSGSIDKTLRVWNIESGKCLHKLFDGHTNFVNSIALTPDGKMAVSGSSDNTLRVWDKSIGKCLYILKGHTDDISSIAITPDGKTAVSGSRDFTLRVWNITNGECIKILDGHTSCVHPIAITPDGKTAVSGSQDKTLRGWNIASGKCLHTLILHDDYYYPGSVGSIAITPNGKTLLSGSLDPTLRVWDISTGKCLRTCNGHTRSIFSVTITPDGKTAISGSEDKTLRVWDISTGKCLCTLEGHTNSVSSVAITSDGKLAVSGSSDKTLRVWDIASGECLNTLEGFFIRIIPDSKTLVFESLDYTLRVWDISSSFCFAALPRPLDFLTAAVTNDCLVFGEQSGRINFIEIKNFDSAPHILTPWRDVKDNTYAFGCTHCRKWSEIPASALGTEISCPKCGKRVKLNPFVIEGDWREIEKAWE